MTEILANGVRLHVQRLAPPPGVPRSGKTIVLLHGLIVDDLSSYYFTLANPLAALLGGRLMHWIDLAGAMAAHRHSRNYVVTASVDHGAARR